MRDEVMRRMELELDSRRDDIRALRAKVEAYKKGYEDQVALKDRHEAGYRETIAQLQTQLATLTAENTRLREVLGYYAQTAISARAVAALRGEGG